MTKRILALDLGTKSCGLAISDPFNLFAIPLQNFSFPENDFSFLINKLKTLFSEYEIAQVLLGYPLRLTNTKSPTTLLVENFSKLFRAHFQYPLIFVDERLSTKKAFATFKEMQISYKKAKANKDVMAATLLLNEYLVNLGK